MHTQNKQFLDQISIEYTHIQNWTDSGNIALVSQITRHTDSQNLGIYNCNMSYD